MIERIFIIKLILTTLILNGCNPVDNNSLEKNLYIEIEYKCDYPGIMYFILDGIKLDNSKKSSYVIKQELNSKTVIQKKYKTLTLEELPEYFQIRIGNYINSIKIHKIKLTYLNNDLIIFGEDLDKYFSFTKNIKYISSDMEIVIRDEDHVSPVMMRLNPNYLKFLERR